MTDDRPSRRPGGARRRHGGGTEPAGDVRQLDADLPRGPQWMPQDPRDDDEIGLAERFDLTGWDAGIPLLLVPVRLETTYARAPTSPELRIRIVPDPVTVRGAAPASPRELEEARDFWTRYHASRGQQHVATWRQFVRRVGTVRAGYLARLVRPTAAADGHLTFPDVDAEVDGPGMATLLPDRWLAIGWVGDQAAFQRFSEPITGPLAVSPDPTAPAERIGSSGLTIDPATAWLFDYDRAVEQGMAITVPLTGTAAIAADGLSTLLVLGIDESQRPDATVGELTGLLEQHSRSSGLAFVPQGTPTNNTETVEAGYRRETLELADLEARELTAYQSDDDDHATRFARALGVSDLELLGRCAHGADRQHARARDMRTALFETVLGTYARQLLADHARGSDQLDVVDGTVVSALRTWFVDWVNGGAPVPSIRVGRQPYGVLPVMRREGTEHAAGTQHHVAAIIDVLIEEWRSALASVPTLDHDLTDASGDTGPTADAEARDAVAAVLANNPHPRRLTVRRASDWSDQPAPVADHVTSARAVAALEPIDDSPIDQIPLLITGGFRWEYDQAREQLDTRYATTLRPLYNAVLQEVVPSGTVLDDVDLDDVEVDHDLDTLPTSRRLESTGGPRTDDDIRGIEQQIEVWVQTDRSLDDLGAITIELAEILPELHQFAGDVIDQLERHELRQRPLRWLDVPGLDGVLGRDDLQLLLTTYSMTSRLWQRALVEGDEPPAGITAGAYLGHLAGRLGVGTSGPGPVIDDPRPGSGAPGMPDLPGPIDLPDLPGPFDPFGVLPPAFVDAAPLLYQLLDATIAQGAERAARGEAVARLAAADPVELEWLLRETLGLGSHRLDAWHTSLATERLASLREAQPDGLYVGSFGFVLDLVRSDDRPTNGFVHAPSLPHAASAAVLRSGWLARGDGDPESPAAVDLGSGRVREADWLLSGVRHGQDLGDLLGARFERSLHDAGLDVAIRPLRLAVAAAHGQGPSAADQPVDGTQLLDLYRDGGLDDTIDGLGLPAKRQDELARLLAAIVSAFDAVDDVTTFEMVHQLVVGNLERAAAVVDGMGPNGGRPPELTGVQTPRSALTIDLRVAVLLDASATSARAGWTPGTRGALDPALDAWAAAILPAPGDVGWRATAADGQEIELRLSDLDVSALDSCYLSDDDPRSMTPAMRRLTELSRPDETLVEVRPGDGGRAPVSLAEFQLLAVELKRMIQESTPATAAAMAAPEDALAVDDDASSTVQRAEETVARLLSQFDEVAAAGSWDDLDPSTAAALARIGLTPSPTVEPLTDFDVLRQRLVHRRERADAVEQPDTADGIRRRVAEVIGVTAPLLVPFPAPGPGGVELAASLADVDEIDEWLDMVSSVRPQVASLGRTLRFGELLGRPPSPMVAGQAPLLDGDPWAALHRPPADTGGRVAVAAVTHGTVEAGAAVVGLVVDQWAERIPAVDQVTGVAFHFDGPSSEAPQTMLLAVPPDGEPWSTDLIVDTLLETIEWAQLRAIAIDDLGDFGHALPTTFVPGSLDTYAVQGATP